MGDETIKQLDLPTFFPSENRLKQAIMETIDFLEESRKAFKSKRFSWIGSEATAGLIWNTLFRTRILVNKLSHIRCHDCEREHNPDRTEKIATNADTKDKFINLFWPALLNIEESGSIFVKKNHRISIISEI